MRLKSPLGNFTESKPVLDYIRLENKFGPQGGGTVSQKVRFSASLDASKKVMWIALSLRLDVESCESPHSPMLLGEIRTHVGFSFEKEQDPSVIDNDEILEMFTEPLYQRTAEMLAVNLNLMGFSINLPLVRPAESVKPIQ